MTLADTDTSIGVCVSRENLGDSHGNIVMTTRNVWGLLIIRNRVSTSLQTTDRWGAVCACAQQTAAGLRHHRWLEAQLVSEGRPGRTDPARSENKQE